MGWMDGWMGKGIIVLFQAINTKVQEQKEGRWKMEGCQGEKEKEEEGEDEGGEGELWILESMEREDWKSSRD